MKTKEIYKLLCEASNKETSSQRRNEIQCIFNSEINHTKPNDYHDKIEGMRLVMESIYVNVCKNRLDLLPNLLPMFALICGDKDERYMIADIDWNYINQVFPIFTLLDLKEVIESDFNEIRVEPTQGEIRKIEWISEAYSMQPERIKVDNIKNFVNVNVPEKRYHRFIKEIKLEFVQISDNERQEYYICYDWNGNIHSQYIAKTMNVGYYYEKIN